MTDTSPYLNRLQEGVEVNKAWEQSKDEIDQSSKYGSWDSDFFLAKPDNTGAFCHANEIRSVSCYRSGKNVGRNHEQVGTTLDNWSDLCILNCSIGEHDY